MSCSCGPEQAEATFHRAENVDSGYWAVHNRFGNFLEGIGRYDEAIERYVKVIQLAPDSEVGYNNLGNAYLSLGKLVESEARLYRFAVTNALDLSEPGARLLLPWRLRQSG